ncbi:MAG: hypothetical protein A2W80_06495 [Candidatus Riflebacteria bacterium GWC2_50_8]|nr:MAG: hypothetical protein A2W80_06495 [Candidatus Riflebacteria bacterium GWC2_50_8]
MSSRRGIVFYIVIAVVSIMGVFILFYHSFSKQLAHSSFYHVNREKLRNYTEVILDSAFNTIQINTRDPNHDLTKRIITQMKSSAIDNAAFPLDAPLFETNKAALLQGATLDYTLTGRVFDKRTSSPTNQQYYSGEGLGTFEIILEASLKAGSKELARCARRRQFDIKTVCMVSNYQKRTSSYAMTFPLDFALLVRNGLREFKEGYRGQSFNDGQKLVIQDQSSIAATRRGLVYFGRADRNNEDSRVFLNTSDVDAPSSAIIPALPSEKFEISQAEVLKLLPELDKNGAAEYQGLKGFFNFSVHPVARTGAPANDKEDEARQVLSVVPGSRKLIPLPAGISFAGNGDKAYLDSFVRGAVTQRYLYLVHFELEADGAKIGDGSGDFYDIPPEGVQDLESKSKFTCFSPDITFYRENASADQKGLELAQRLVQVEQRTNPPVPLTSDFVEDYLCYSGQNMQKAEVTETFDDAPRFYGRDSSPLGDLNMTGSEGFRPFGHYALFSARYLRAFELEKHGVYDKKNGILNLRGVVSVELDHVTFDPPPGQNHILVRGVGAILAPAGFTLNCGLKREDPSRDLCILFTRRGNIRLVTSDRVEASLMAFNDSNSGSLSPSRAFDVQGAVGVDQLYLSRFPTTPSRVEFDPRLRADTDAGEVFAVNMSPWIRYDDISFSRE